MSPNLQPADLQILAGVLQPGSPKVKVTPESPKGLVIPRAPDCAL